MRVIVRTITGVDRHLIKPDTTRCLVLMLHVIIITKVIVTPAEICNKHRNYVEVLRCKNVRKEFGPFYVG